MRKTILAAAVVATATAATITGTTLAASGAPGVPLHFTVVERALTDTTADTGPAGDSLGDVLAFANPVYDATDTNRVGRDLGSCIRTAVGASYECTWTTILRGGSMVVTGPFYDTSDSVLAVTGGTGVYRNVGGQMRLHARNAAGTEFDFAFSIIRR